MEINIHNGEVPTLTLVLGGSRSGKTGFSEAVALKYAEAKAAEKGVKAPLYYFATCPRALDQEMDERIARHVATRSASFQTIENRLDLHGVAKECAGAIILVDCLTLWLSGLLIAGKTNAAILEELNRDLVATRGLVHWVFVSNEVGMGIVPMGEESRSFRDLAGLANQSVAALAERVYFVVAGLPMSLK